jgi:8-oxo-dGTP pyrophosphatase MutT (NUDIX family)
MKEPYVKQILFFGYKGNISPSPIYKEIDKPIIELDGNNSTPEKAIYLSKNYEVVTDDLIQFFQPYYRQWGRYGYMGDIIAIKKIVLDACVNLTDSHIYVLEYFGRLAPIKALVAADLIPIIKTGVDEFYFVGVRRKYDPGKGLPALMGGLVDVNGYHLDTAAETVIHEAKEEIGLELFVYQPQKLKSLSPINIDVSARYKGQKCFGALIPQGVYLTGSNEEMPQLGLKRVYQTTAYVLLLDMINFGLNGDDIKNWLHAGDDAASLEVINLKNKAALCFGLSHHQEIFDQTIKSLVEKSLI